MRILLIDDHPLFRQGLALLLAELAEQVEFLEAESCEQALSFEDAAVDLILLDVTLPGMSGIEGIAPLRARWPQAPLVLLTAHESPQLMVEGVKRGAAGFIAKSSVAAVMLAALRVVLAGGTYLPTGVVGAGAADEADTPQELTTRQLEVLRLLVDGCSNKEIAERLGMRVNTVRVHVAAVLRALGVDNRVEAAREALRLGLAAKRA